MSGRIKQVCPTCDGSGWSAAGPTSAGGYCADCRGYGEVTPEKRVRLTRARNPAGANCVCGAIIDSAECQQRAHLGGPIVCKWCTDGPREICGHAPAGESMMVRQGRDVPGELRWADMYGAAPNYVTDDRKLRGLLLPILDRAVGERALTRSEAIAILERYDGDR